MALKQFARYFAYESHSYIIEKGIPGGKRTIEYKEVLPGCLYRELGGIDMAGKAERKSTKVWGKLTLTGHNSCYHFIPGYPSVQGSMFETRQLNLYRYQRTPLYVSSSI